LSLLAQDHATTLDGGVITKVSLQNKNLAVKVPVSKKFTANIANMAPPECQPVGCPERTKVFYGTADLLINL